MSTLPQVAAPLLPFILVGGGAFAAAVTVAYLRSKATRTRTEQTVIDDVADFYRLSNQCQYALDDASAAVSGAADKARLKEVYDDLIRIFGAYFMGEHESFIRGLNEGKGLQKMVATDVRDQLSAAESILTRHSNARSNAALTKVRNLRKTIAHTMSIPATR
ncbi:hypothetical protein [Mycobacteroides abscessus]|uniref:hypothetical protein n=1 Tax=Mycobacteroides abscessus TaxID=36809 RepID=UPI0009A71EB5|nr:hypothetical protein [Mycobacteroides abscessus]SKH88137.1 Uncharacterised protein [Mycobacteroides abscessus subsp. massiliense]SKH92111.1 Uncharacterised protein [Mycobacteroides abscessus subsp. massiliense]SKI12625.1 Uncharacterised protein [Mycobacteroides abscessus subsp. massiliense]SKK21445.1 Uncharacterised protein [Mycobacteroides abscessus subsp. massiliense]SKK31765.1 Uncharacterised protein [Mycobacteroides abscessus subsp. massiliense]